MTPAPGQHFYARVAKAQSPAGIEGLQTLFFTRASLTEARARSLESRLSYYPAVDRPIKRVFHVTEWGSPVLTQIVNRAGVDREGRPVGGLAHSLVFPPESLACPGLSVFRIFHEYPFVQSLEAACAAANLEERDYPPATLTAVTAAESIPPSLASWDTAELRKLLFLALRARRLADEVVALALTGDAVAIEAALEVVHFLLPAPLWARCTFDTYFVDGSGCPGALSATYYWAVGLPAAPRSPQFIQVDATTRTIAYEAYWKPANLFEFWLEERTSARQWEEIDREKHRLYALSELLDGQAVEAAALDSFTPEEMRELFQTHTERVRGAVRRRLQPDLGEALAESAAHLVVQFEPVDVVFRGLREGFALPRVLDLLYERYASLGFRPPELAEVQGLGQTLEVVKHLKLTIVHGLWTSAREQVQAVLEVMSPPDYDALLRRVLDGHFLDPLRLLSPGKATRFLAVLEERGVLLRLPLAEVVAALLDCGAPEQLDGFRTRLLREPLEGLEAIDALIRNRRNLPPAFVAALNAELAVKRPKGLLRFFARRKLNVP